MATLIPIDNTVFTTEGEKRFYHFLRTTVKPDDRCYAWYSPSVEGLEPDFVLYTPEVGLVVFEVKDWVLSQILRADSQRFVLAVRDRQETRTHPLQQARKYTFAILDRMRSAGRSLLSTDPRYKGRPRIPVHSGAVLCNITRMDFEKTDLPNVLDPQKVFFADDLALAEVKGASLPNMRCLLETLFPPPFPFQAAPHDIERLREVLWPEVRLALPRRAGSQPENNDPDRIRRLDLQQESLARRLDAPQAMITGPAGSGKTLVLVHKAISECRRLRQTGSERPVLFLCFNLTLVNYLRRLLSEHQAPLGRRGIEVKHFYAFCQSLLDEPLTYENEDGNYYHTVTQLALESISGQVQYGAVFIDEGQDFSDDMIAVARAVCVQNGLFWLACDQAQGLYEQKQEKNFSGRRFHLQKPYRATRALTSFCEILAGRDGQDADDAPLPDPAPVHLPDGSPPLFYRAETPDAAVSHLAACIHRLHAAGLPYSEIMILYAIGKHPCLNGRQFPLLVMDHLEDQGILCSWPAKDAQSKLAWYITTDSVTISTIHSMKGLDAEAVFIWGLDFLDDLKHPPQSTRALAYAGASRARKHLEVIYANPSAIIRTMLAASQGKDPAENHP